MLPEVVEDGLPALFLKFERIPGFCVERLDDFRRPCAIVEFNAHRPAVSEEIFRIPAIAG